MLLSNWPGADEFKSNIESDSVSGTKKDKEHPYNFRYQICLTDQEGINQIKGEKKLYGKNLQNCYVQHSRSSFRHSILKHFASTI